MTVIDRRATSWRHYRRAFGAPPAAAATEPVWRPCPTCWQQGVAVQREEDGTWTVLRCGTCLGVREVLR